mgnify:FL=1
MISIDYIVLNNKKEGDIKMNQDVSLDNFCEWLIKERKNFENKLKDDCIKSQNLLKEFLNDWPLDNLKNISLDEYIKLGKDINTGGKYSNLYMSIGGGTSAKKFLISQNKDKNDYKITNGKYEDTIEKEAATIYFNELREDLVDILENGINFKFDKIKSTNRFFNCSAMIIKLLSIYSNSNEGIHGKRSYFSFNNGNKYQNIFNQLLPKKDDVYAQNHEITKYIDEKVPNLDQVILSYSIHRYVDAMNNNNNNDNNDINKQEREKNQMSYSDILTKSQNLILHGAPGTGKTYLAKEIALELTGGNEDQIGFVQFHPSYDYTDFVEGLRPVSNGDGTIEFKLVDGIFKKFCQKARDAKKTGGQDKFVFIIDEINRGEISKIFGELFFSIDPGYRGEKGSVSTQYANLHETDEKFYIPENVYIIGTMNDIDRSVDTFDFAMRRRFRFVEVTAESQVGMLDKELNIHAEEAKTRLRNLNAAIENVQELNSHYHIGPSYFLKLEEVDFDYELLWSDYLKPLLEDYLRGSYEEAETLDTLKKAFDLTNNEQTVQQDTGDDNADY